MYVDGKLDSAKSLKPIKPDIYDIGLGKENIRIRTNGMLHFTVNDIALTQRVIDSMIKQLADDSAHNKPNSLEIKEYHLAMATPKFDALFIDSAFKNRFHAFKTGDTIILEKWNCKDLYEMGFIDVNNRPIKSVWDIEKLKKVKLVDDSLRFDSLAWKQQYLIDSGFIKSPWSINELQYYRQNHFVDAWFVDNIGSFLIVIERKRVK